MLRPVGMLHDLIYGPEPGPLLRALPAPPPETGQPPGTPLSLGQMIADAVAAREQGVFSLREALRMPAVARGVSILCSVTASFTPFAYLDSVSAEVQPRILRRPTPFGTRYEFLFGTMFALLAGDEDGGQPGNAFWLVTSRTEDEIPEAVVLLKNAEVNVSWADDRRFLPKYVWRGKDITRDIVHLALGRPPGALLGRSPIAECLDALAVVDAAEDYALAYFATAGIPSVTLHVPTKQTKEESEALQRAWLAARAGPGQTPAVLSGGITDTYPNADAQRAQMQESRSYGATIVSRLLGIPRP